MIHDSNQAIVPFNRETNQPVNPRHSHGREGQEKILSKDCVPEIQNSNQSRSHPFDVIAILANLMNMEGNNTSPTPIFKHPRIGEANSINEGRSTSILKHIRIIKEDDQDVCQCS
jgi:hypothetical protein